MALTAPLAHVARSTNRSTPTIAITECQLQTVTADRGCHRGSAYGTVPGQTSPQLGPAGLADIEWTTDQKKARASGQPIEEPGDLGRLFIPANEHRLHP